MMTTIMTNEEIIRMAREAGWKSDRLTAVNAEEQDRKLQKFAALVAEATKAQPQGEWVDLTPNEVTEQIREGAADGGWQGFAQRIIAKFKEKNTPPVVQQGEPVAWLSQGGMFTTDKSDADRWIANGFEATPLYTTPPSVEANDYVLCEVQQEWYVKGWKDAVEKAAKVCEHYALLKRYDDDPEPSMGYAAEECAAAIRRMK